MAKTEHPAVLHNVKSENVNQAECSNKRFYMFVSLLWAN